MLSYSPLLCDIVWFKHSSFQAF